LPTQPAPEVGHAIAQPGSTTLPLSLDQSKNDNLPSGKDVAQTTTTKQAIPSTVPVGVSRTITEKGSAIELPSSKPIQKPTATSINIPREATQPNNIGAASTTTPNAENDSASSASGQFQRPPLPKKRKRRNTETDSATGEEGTRIKKPRGKRKREPTPEESEQIEIAPAVVRMSELCKDLRTGKKSQRELELRNLELAETERKQKAKEKSRNSSTPVKPDVENANGVASTTPSKSQTGPRMRIVNGEIVIDNASLQLDQRAEAAREFGEMENVVENRLNRKINQATYGKRTKAESWDEDLTDLFYRGLRMFGTDFSLISNMFPGRSRRQIKLKFNNEERRDPERIKQTLLGPRESIDIQTYSELTNKVYDDLEVIQKELDDDKRRIEEQHAKEVLANDEQMRNPSGTSNDTNVIPSVENIPVKKRNSISKSR
jgi:transcription factor TFIIIB component B''